ncbi:MAG: hypothetical protein LBT20_06200, partial [Clostridiales bacterium]|nr:hypothetical protein [Clostridiales bacterium]
MRCAQGIKFRLLGGEVMTIVEYFKQKKSTIFTFSFAVLFVVLFLSMMLNYMTEGVETLRLFVTIVKVIMTVAVFFTVIFYQWARLATGAKERSVNVLLNLFAAVDCLFIFYSNNVNVFKITLSLYLVFGVSTIVWVAVRLFHGKYDIYSVFSEIRVSLIVMAAVLLTHGVLLVTNKVTPDETLESAYMFFGTAALV